MYFYPSPRWFSLNNSKTVNAVTLEFCSIQQHAIRDIRAKFGIHNLPQSPDIGQNPDGGISDFWISGQSLIKKFCHNSRTSDDIDMKFGPVTKLDKRNKTTSKKSGDRIPDTESEKVMFSVIVTFCLTKTENRTKKSQTQLSHYSFE